MIDMKMLWLQLKWVTPEEVRGNHGWFYVRPGHNGQQYVGIMFNEESDRKPAQGHALYRIKVTFK